MKRLGNPTCGLIFLFIAIIVTVPLVQAFRELGTEDGVRAFEVFSEVPNAGNLRAFEKDLEKASWAAAISRQVVQFAQFAWLKYGGEKVIFGSRGWYFFKPGLNYMLARPEPFGLRTNDPVSAIVDFRDQLAAAGVHLLVMPVPNKDTVYPDRLSSRVGTSGGAQCPRTREFLQELFHAGVQVVDLFKEFSEAREGENATLAAALYLAQDTHWSPAGVSLAAKAAASRLIELGWVGPGQTEYSERPAPVQRVGDIVRMLQLPKVEKYVHAENVRAVQIVRHDTGQPYKDDVAAEILVIGDSFMRIFQQDTPTAAGFIAHLARELKQPMMSLVNDGGGSTLVREELCARPVLLQHKKVVLWEFVERDIGMGVKGWKPTPLAALP